MYAYTSTDTFTLTQWLLNNRYIPFLNVDIAAELAALTNEDGVVEVAKVVKLVTTQREMRDEKARDLPDHSAMLGPVKKTILSYVVCCVCGHLAMVEPEC